MTELEKAIEVIEQAGGFVMMADDFDERNRDEYLQDLEKQEKAQQEQLIAWQNERKESLEEMQKDFAKMLGSKNFSFTAVEDMVHGYGCDMDDLEDLIHNYY